MHLKYLKRFSTKVQLMYSQINNDIKFDKTADMNNKNQKKDLLNAIASEHKADKNLLKDLRESINDKNKIYRMDSIEIGSSPNLQSLSTLSPSESDSESIDRRQTVNLVMSNILNKISTNLDLEELSNTSNSSD